MKVHQVVLAVVDFDEIGAEGVRQIFEHMSDSCDSMLPTVRSVKTMDIGEWSDDHPLNDLNREEDELRRLFGPA